MTLTDEELGAYLDGELDAVAAARVDAALAADADARARLDALRAADRRLREALPVSASAQDDALAALIMGAGTQGAGTGQPSARVARRPRRFQQRYWALAAGVAGLALGLGLAGKLERLRSSVPQLAGVPTEALGEALESRASGATMVDGLRMVLSFRADDGRYCRIFEARGAASGEGLACREQGQWRLLAWDSTAPPAEEGPRPAGAGVIDGAADALGSAQALEPPQEQALIGRRWAE